MFFTLLALCLSSFVVWATYDVPESRFWFGFNVALIIINLVVLLTYLR